MYDLGAVTDGYFLSSSGLDYLGILFLMMILEGAGISSALLGATCCPGKGFF